MAGNIIRQDVKALSGGMVVGILYQGEQVSIPSPEAVQLHCADLRKILETEADERWGGMSAFIYEEGTRLPIDAAPYQDGAVGRREDLMRYLGRAGRLLVLGETGSGKTVALQRLAWELCQSTKPLIPVIVPLLFYAGTPLDEWVRALLQETNHLRLDDNRALAAFLHEGETRCFFLFDGLNEVRPIYADRLKDELVRWMKTYPRHAIILTSRVPDELWRTLRSQVQETVVIQPIAEAQVEAYFKSHLGADHGQKLFNQLDPRLRALAQRPLLLWLIKEAYAPGESLPGNRGELYAHFVSRLLSRDTDDRQLDTDFSERLKRQAVGHLAYVMHRQHMLTCQRDEAVDIVARKFDHAQADALVRVLARHGLLLSDQQVRFPHQTLQEHFAAVELQEQVRQEQALNGLRRLARNLHELVRGPLGLAALATDEWWGESLIHLAGLVDDPAWLVRTIARVNPWLAWWCIEEGRCVDNDTHAMIEARSVRLLRPASPVTDRRRAVQTLAQMKSDRVMQPLMEAAADDDAEVVGLAMRVLVEMGESVHSLVGEVLQGKDEQLWIAALRYLRIFPTDPLWTQIPDRMWSEFLEPADRRNLVMALESLGNDWAIETLFRIAGEKDAEVAAQALTKWSKLVSPLVGDALRGKDQRYWRVALRCLGTQPRHPLWAEIPAEVWEQVLGQPLVWVPPGPFRMGSDKNRDSKALYDELPQHELALPGYWIGRYPVTVAQWRAFVNESGHKLADTGSLNDPDDRPVRWVDWHDAMDYCHWWSEKTGLALSLPSEAEWEKAARGPSTGSGDGRTYPWGDEFDLKKCNSSESGIRTTTPVDKYSPTGDSPYGCADMAGNVWEWTRSKYKPYPYNADDGRESLKGGELRALRGGSWDGNLNVARAAGRVRDDPSLRADYYGFRVVVRPPSQ